MNVSGVCSKVSTYRAIRPGRGIFGSCLQPTPRPCLPEIPGTNCLWLLGLKSLKCPHDQTTLGTGVTVDDKHHQMLTDSLWQNRLYLSTWQQKMTTIMQPFHCDLQQLLFNHPFQLHTHTHDCIQSSLKPPLPCGKEKKARTTPATLAAHMGCPSYGKTQGFVLRLPPQNQPHATCMQPLHCALQKNVA